MVPTTASPLGWPSAAITVELSSPAPSTGPNVTLSTSSAGGGSPPPRRALQRHPRPALDLFRWQLERNLLLQDTVAGSPTVTASASGWGSATLPITVSAGQLKTIKVPPSTVTLAQGGSQLFTASGAGTYGNPVSISRSSTTTVAGANMGRRSGTSSTLQTTTSGTGLVTAAQGSVSVSANVTVAAQSTLSVKVTAGALSGSLARYEVPLTVSVDNATTNAAVSGASVTLQVFGNATCTGTATASGTGTTASTGQVTFDLTTRTAGTWCALAAVSATGFSQGSRQISFSA